MRGSWRSWLPSEQARAQGDLAVRHAEAHRPRRVVEARHQALAHQGPDLLRGELWALTKERATRGGGPGGPWAGSGVSPLLPKTPFGVPIRKTADGTRWSSSGLANPRTLILP